MQGAGWKGEDSDMAVMPIDSTTRTVQLQTRQTAALISMREGISSPVPLLPDRGGLGQSTGSHGTTD